MNILSIQNLGKTYAGGHVALDSVSLDINKGEIFALLGPNGAGKTTMISIICGLVVPTSGHVKVGGHDIITDFRKTRAMIGLVPQELSVDGFESVIGALKFSRALFGRKRNDAYLERILADLSLTDKRDAPIMSLSGGMKRRVLIAKALAHEPEVLFLDEPTAGVDVNLRKDMWAMIGRLREAGTTIILTTHYIEEAEEMADRVGVISGGKLLLVEDKSTLMSQMGKKELRLSLDTPIDAVPPSLAEFDLQLIDGGAEVKFHFDTKSERTGIRTLLNAMDKAGLAVVDMETRQSSLEEIFMELVEGSK